MFLELTAIIDGRCIYDADVLTFIIITFVYDGCRVLRILGFIDIVHIIDKSNRVTLFLYRLFTIRFANSFLNKTRTKYKMMVCGTTFCINLQRFSYKRLHKILEIH